MSNVATKDVNVFVEYLARCEGETALKLSVSGDGTVKEFMVNLYEPARFFEGFLVGRKWYDAYETTSRICGICSVPHQLSGIEATELAFGVEPSPQTKIIRKIANMSELYMNCVVHGLILGGPDFFGVPSVFEIAAMPDKLELVKTALKLKRLGNDVTDLVCGRETHPVTFDVGRMRRLPSQKAVDSIRARLEEALPAADVFAQVMASLNYPDYKRKVELVSIHDDKEYALNYGNIVSTEGLNITPDQHDEYLPCEHIKHSHALFYKVKGRDSFMVGPHARVVNNFNQLTPNAQALARKYWGGPEWFHENMPFSVYPAHAVELLHCGEEMIELLGKLKLTRADREKEERPKAVPKAGQGYICTEAPRGLLYYSFRFDEKGDVEFADIVTPTAHHVYNLELDLLAAGPKVIGMSDEEATMYVEMIARCYDLCCSCSVHMIKK